MAGGVKQHLFASKQQWRWAFATKQSWARKHAEANKVARPFRTLPRRTSSKGGR